MATSTSTDIDIETAVEEVLQTQLRDEDPSRLPNQHSGGGGVLEA